MGPPKSTVEGWKHVTRDGNNVKCRLCGHHFTGSLTRIMDHLLGISRGRGGDVAPCGSVTLEIRTALEKDQSSSISRKMKLVQRKQRIQDDMSKFTTSFVSSSA
ncbi:hypothetical protein KI387_016697, partial [Taxus chinensis]